MHLSLQFMKDILSQTLTSITLEVRKKLQLPKSLSNNKGNFADLKKGIYLKGISLGFLFLLLGILNSFWFGNVENKTKFLFNDKQAAEEFKALGQLAEEPKQQASEQRKSSEKVYEVFGFAPYWTFDKLDNVNFETLTTLAYFSITVDGNGNLDKGDQGYIAFKSDKATEIFQKAHKFGTRVVLTLTQMRNEQILALLDSPEAEERVINQAVSEVSDRGIDGINVDFEYNGNPGPEYRKKFTDFVRHLTDRMHQANPNSKVTVSVYAASIKDPKIYDIGALADVSDGIFMMAYDFAPVSADQAIPTAPLYGHKEGQYWYDISTAVDDFLKVMPAEKLILGVPWYGYDYPVSAPEVKASTLPYWLGRPLTQTYAAALENINPEKKGIVSYQEGWDDLGKVGWRAYYSTFTGTWRMIFLEDQKSLGIKYDFAKSKNLAGVGIWALGFDGGKADLWHTLEEKFGKKDTSGKILAGNILGEKSI